MNSLFLVAMEHFQLITDTKLKKKTDLNNRMNYEILWTKTIGRNIYIVSNSSISFEWVFDCPLLRNISSYVSVSFFFSHLFWFFCFVFLFWWSDICCLSQLQTLNPKAINFSTVSSRKKNVNTKFIKLKTSSSIRGASWN